MTIWYICVQNGHFDSLANHTKTDIVGHNGQYGQFATKGTIWVVFLDHPSKTLKIVKTLTREKLFKEYMCFLIAWVFARIVVFDGMCIKAPFRTKTDIMDIGCFPR